MLKYEADKSFELKLPSLHQVCRTDLWFRQESKQGSGELLPKTEDLQKPKAVSQQCLYEPILVFQLVIWSCLSFSL